MTRFLVATDSVHTTAAACDYLQTRVGPDDEVIVVAVVEAGDGRDAGDALNVAGVRLPAPAVETVRREGDPADELLACAADRDADELVIGASGGTPGAAADLGSTARRVLAAADRPVVVLPPPAP